MFLYLYLCLYVGCIDFYFEKLANFFGLEKSEDWIEQLMFFLQCPQSWGGKQKNKGPGSQNRRLVYFLNLATSDIFIDRIIAIHLNSCIQYLSKFTA